jgi:hypothetical protein
MINFSTMKVGDKVRVVGAGAPGFAKVGEVLTVIKLGHHRVDVARYDGEEAYFALTCGASRLEVVEGGQPCDEAFRILIPRKDIRQTDDPEKIPEEGLCTKA